MVANSAPTIQVKSGLSFKKMKPSLQEGWDLLQNPPSERCDALTDDSSDESVPANYLLELSHIYTFYGFRIELDKLPESTKIND
ncbi:UNVERIFIED_CONTAM: hypothetical protein NCL1_48385 [Trichonephila clavipes]